MDEYIFQSRAVRILFYTEGAVISVCMLALIPYMLSGARSTDRFFRPSPESREAMAQLAQQAQHDPRAAKALLEAEEADRQAASFRRSMSLMAYESIFMSLSLLPFGLAMIVVPIAAARQRRRRASAWETLRQGRPVYRISLALELATIPWAILICAALLCLHFLDIPFRRGQGIVVSVSLGIVLVMFAHALTSLIWRFHCRDWRIRLAEVPVRPGESVHFEIFRETGKPICKDLRMEFVGLAPKWNTKRDCYRSGWLLLRTIGGEVHLEAAPGPAPRSISGVLRFEDSGLAAVPPDGVKHPRRLIPFLRLRKGWWRRCFFDLPAPALYIRPEAERHGSVDERRNER